MRPDLQRDILEVLRDPGYVGQQAIFQRAAAEIARLRARPTEEEVTRAMVCFFAHERDCRAAARAVLALFPKVQP